MGIIFGSPAKSSNTEYKDIIHNETDINNYLLNEVNQDDYIGVNNTPMVISYIREENNISKYQYDRSIKVKNHYGIEFQLLFDETLVGREPAVYDPRIKSIQSRIDSIRPEVVEVIKYEFI